MSQYYVLKGRSSLSDRQGPWADEDVLWNPGQYTSQKYIRYVQALEKELSIESGLVDLEIDEIEVDPDGLEAFARRLLEELAQTSDEVNAAQIRPVLGPYSQTNHPLKTKIWAVLGPAVVMADRAGRPLKAHTPREDELLADARALMATSGGSTGAPASRSRRGADAMKKRGR